MEYVKKIIEEVRNDLHDLQWVYTGPDHIVKKVRRRVWFKIAIKLLFLACIFGIPLGFFIAIMFGIPIAIVVLIFLSFT